MNLDRRLLKLVTAQPRPFIGSIISGSLGGAALVAQAWLLCTVVTILFLEQSDIAAIPLYLLLFGAVSLLRALVSWAAQIEANRGTLSIKKNLHSRLTAVMASLGPNYTASKQSGQLSTTILRGIEALDPYFSQYIPQLFLSLIIPLTILAAVIPSDPLSGLILLGTAPLIPLFMILIGKAAQNMTEKQWKTLSRMSGYFLDVLQGLTTLKLFGRSRDRIASIEQMSEAFRASTMKVLKIAFLSSLTLELVGTIGTAIIAVQIGLRLLAGALDFHTAFFVLLLTPDFYLPLRQLGTKFHAGMEGVSAANEIFPVLEHESESTHPDKQTSSPVDPFRPISFNDVCVRYPGSTENALGPVSFTIEPGTKTAIIGQSGAGKTTCTQLLLRFITPSSGNISIGEDNLQSIPASQWQRHIAWVSQQPWLFNTSLRENLLMARPDATREELNAAIASSGLTALIDALPEGLETIIGEQGSRMSGGEAQRLAIARAFIRNAPILVLDEPTSHTDPHLEESLQKSLKTLMKGRTTIVIAHRLNTIMDADRIIVLHNGTILQEGTHEELIGKEGYYRTATMTAREAGI
ncbi:MAG: thiol reductant ABC exporter subunit CydD [Prosthecochloris sp.]|uniref:thiol reductant ABC exporter subunit CydD n=1 Tax=Prosthecochloris sp. TaxID=290513 RepID=UPI00258F8D14|nr:thiol reductant ABC exporter subunit CydD [Prosthecochloris sp.]MCW8799065.1 thiol reductant ABC exporter subunit CydD [Prosthecochloris sp.]